MSSSVHATTLPDHKNDDVPGKSTVSVPDAEELSKIEKAVKYTQYGMLPATIAIKKIAARVLSSMTSVAAKAAMTDVIESGAMKLATEVTIEVATKTILRATIIGVLQALGPIATAADIALAVFGVIGLIYDRIDPHHYSETYFRSTISTMQKQMTDQVRNNMLNNYKHQLETTHGEETESFKFPMPVHGTDVHNSKEWHMDSQEIVTAVTKYVIELLPKLTVNSRGEIIDYSILKDMESDAAKRLAKHPPEWNKFVHDCMQSVMPMHTRIHRTIACLDAKVERAESMSKMWWICLVAGGTAAGVVASTRKRRLK
ncbi:U22-like protein [Lissonota sp. PSUC_FEM 10030012]|nr:U22-like protein [Lissonota sp. PSUC_FEM 10030012]